MDKRPFGRQSAWEGGFQHETRSESMLVEPEIYRQRLKEHDWGVSLAPRLRRSFSEGPAFE